MWEWRNSATPPISRKRLSEPRRNKPTTVGQRDVVGETHSWVTSCRCNLNRLFKPQDSHRCRQTDLPHRTTVRTWSDNAWALPSMGLAHTVCQLSPPSLSPAGSPNRDVDVHEGQGTLDIQTPDPGTVMLSSLYNPGGRLSSSRRNTQALFWISGSTWSRQLLLIN